MILSVVCVLGAVRSADAAPPLTGTSASTWLVLVLMNRTVPELGGPAFELTVESRWNEPPGATWVGPLSVVVVVAFAITLNVTMTEIATFQSASPGWAAVTLHLPCDTRWSRPPTIVHAPEAV